MYRNSVLYIKYMTNSSRLVPPSAPTRGVFMRGDGVREVKSYIIGVTC